MLCNIKTHVKSKHRAFFVESKDRSWYVASLFQTEPEDPDDRQKQSEDFDHISEIESTFTRKR